MDLDSISLTGLALQAGVIVGLTAVVGKLINRFFSTDNRDVIMPIVAVLIGVGVTSLGEAAMSNVIYQGIVLGGTVTGLYPIAQDSARLLASRTSVSNQTVNQPKGEVTVTAPDVKDEKSKEIGQ